MHEKDETRPIEEKTESTVTSFNDVTDHYQKIMGVPTQRADLNSMPKVLRWFAYFFYTVLILGALLFLISWLIQ
ncbi:hypothetical protein [Paenibacillus sp. YAF4_2]|uniref:hypothetical protein n=1 Tax=Paenibacillus sp. YAF4_2 TaxID=3233085 RepID=UPI003F9D9266